MVSACSLPERDGSIRLCLPHCLSFVLVGVFHLAFHLFLRCLLYWLVTAEKIDMLFCGKMEQNKRYKLNVLC